MTCFQHFLFFDNSHVNRIRSANHNHMMALLQQLLYSESLSLSWRDIIVPVVRQIVQTVRPDVRSCDDDMDIRQLVHIKKVGSLSHSYCNVPWSMGLGQKSKPAYPFFVRKEHLFFCRFQEERSLTPSWWMALFALKILLTKRCVLFYIWIYFKCTSVFYSTHCRWFCFLDEPLHQEPQDSSA